MSRRAYMVLLATLAIGACQIEKPSMEMMFNPGSLPSLDASGCAQVEIGYFDPEQIAIQQSYECKLSCVANAVMTECSTIGKEPFEDFKRSIKNIFDMKKIQSAEIKFTHTIKSMNIPLLVKIDRADVLIGGNSYRILPTSNTMLDGGNDTSFPTGIHAFQESVSITYSQIENGKFPKWEILMRLSNGICNDNKYKNSTLTWNLEQDQAIQGLKVECK